MRTGRVLTALVVAIVVGVGGSLVAVEPAAAAASSTMTIAKQFGLTVLFTVTTSAAPTSGKLRITATGGPDDETLIYDDISQTATRTEQLVPVTKGGTWTFSVASLDGSVAPSAPVTTAVDDWRPTFVQNADRSLTATFPPPNTTNQNDTYFVTIFGLTDSSGNGPFGYVPGQNGKSVTTVTIPADQMTPGVVYDTHLRYEIAISPNIGPTAPNMVPAKYWVQPKVSRSYGAPSNFAVAPFDGRVDLSWATPLDPPPSPTYRVDYRAVGAANWSSVPVNAATSYTVNGLTNGTNYEFRVFTLNGASQELPTETLQATPVRVPDAPSVTGAASADGALVVSASFPSSAAAPSDPARAVWEVAPAGTSSWSVRTPSTSAPYTLGGLTNGTAYSVRVRAVNGTGSTQGASAGPFTPYALPAGPLVGTPVQKVRSFTVAAGYPATVGAPVVSTEWQLGRVVGGAVAAGDWVAATPAEAAGVFTFSSGLTSGNDYRVRTRSVNATGAGAWTESATVRVIDVPAVPAIRSVTAGDTILTADVDLGATDARPSDLSRAVVQASTDGGDTWSTVTAVVVSGKLEIRNRVNGAPHLLRIRGVNDVGTSAYSAESAAVAPVAAPATPSFGAVRIGDGTGTAAFSQPSTTESPAAQTELRVLEWTSSTVSTVVAGNTPTLLDGAVTASGLENGKVYTIEGRSLNAAGASNWASTARFTPLAVPSAPTLGTPTPEDGSVTISAAFDTAASRISDPADAIWEISTTDPTVWHTVTATQVSPSLYRISGLTNGVALRIRVTAVNATGAGAPAVSTDVTPIEAPADPTIHSVAAQDGALLVDATIPDSAAAPATTLTWEVAPMTFAANDGDDEISVGPPSAGTVLADSVAVPPHGWTQSLGAWTTTTATLVDGKWRIDGLDNGTSYRVRLTVSNTSGASEPRVSANSTPFGSPAAPVFRAAGAQNSAISAALVPNATPAAPVDSLEWQVALVTGPTAGQWRTVAVSPLDSLQLGSGAQAETVGYAYRLSGLANGTDYQVRVRAANVRGAGPWTAWSTTLTPAATSVPGEVPTPDPTPGTPAPDTDNDGVPNIDDPDVDGDGIPNATDPDIDGDGIANVFDPDVDGDGTLNGNDSDADGDRVPNASDPTPLGIGTLTDIDGDGIPNESDPDMDGDGVANVFDPDIDGDGIPNATDPTPAGPGSQPGDTGPGNLTDIDGDGIPNAIDPDVDGDGIANVFDPDVDGDGTPNGTDPDADGDGTANGSDSTPLGIGTLTDIDGDGIPNESDPDIDGDGIVNVLDPDIDGDGIPNATDPTPAGPGSQPGDTGIGRNDDLDGDGIPNGIDPDVDGDGIANVFDPDVDGDGTLNGNDSDADGDRVPNASDPTPLGIGTLTDIDGDGIPNESDPDMDGDGVANVFDPDIDGDGIPNATDPTPAGPGSQPGDTGPGNLTDIDGDGIPNAIDPDVDGDGIANVFDPDVDGDGTPNGTDPDADGDGTANGSDSTPLGIGTLTDIDGDGIPNESDPDIDGDGIVNVLDPDIDGDGIPNATDPTPAGPGSQPGSTGPGRPGDIDGDGIPDQIDDDIDGDGIPNGIDPDVDGDGIPNGSDPDVDGDGIPNGSDPDVDGDGIPNGQDDDIDGDGIPNGSDPDVDGDGIPNGSDPDVDGDGIPNGSDPDVDGDGIVNVYDPDVDGDGIPNASDPDADGDGIPNASDPTPNGIGTEQDLDGDGIPNGDDTDMDGDGRNNSSDGDIDGDGIPNGTDTTPAGPGSGSGDTGPGTVTDTDGDGIPNGSDPDVDGDGIPNGQDPDVDGDGIPNGLDPDVDGDGIPNGSDPDIDGDGIPNATDPDIDGDGIANVFDPDVDGDGIPNGSDPDIDGDGTPNALDPTPNGIGSLDDIDGDGIPNDRDGDIDGDGTPNHEDGDIDGDGIPNAQDPDMDGDGTPNGSDSTPNGPERDIALPTTSPTSTGAKGKTSTRSGSLAAGSPAAEGTTQNILLAKGGTTRTASVDAATSPEAETVSDAPADLTAQLVLGGVSLLLLLAGAWFLLARRRRRRES
ncbi:fibronectin type III domain-containing protein [Amnibacterium flavum]|nr:fibronectin type III domain-containing protein [Amnibacterium flavum]